MRDCTACSARKRESGSEPPGVCPAKWVNTSRVWKVKRFGHNKGQAPRFSATGTYCHLALHSYAAAESTRCLGPKARLSFTLLYNTVGIKKGCIHRIQSRNPIQIYNKQTQSPEATPFWNMKWKLLLWTRQSELVWWTDHSPIITDHRWMMCDLEYIPFGTSSEHVINIQLSTSDKAFIGTSQTFLPQGINKQWGATTVMKKSWNNNNNFYMSPNTGPALDHQLIVNSEIWFGTGVCVSH